MSPDAVMFQSLGKILMLFGIFLFVIGVAIFLVDKFGLKFPFIGRLPGDILIQKRNFTFYFPLTTSILLSLILTAILWLISFLMRRH